MSHTACVVDYVLLRERGEQGRWVGVMLVLGGSCQRWCLPKEGGQASQLLPQVRSQKGILEGITLQLLYLLKALQFT